MLKAHEVAQIEKIIGRKMRPHEIQQSKLDNAEVAPTTLDERIEAGRPAVDRQNWKPVLAATQATAEQLYSKTKQLKPGTPEHLKALDVWRTALKEESLQIAEEQANKEAQTERRKSMSLAEKQVEKVRLDRAEFEAQQASKKSHADHLAAVKPQIDKLMALRVEMDADSDYDEADLFAVDKAVIQLQTAGGCKVTAAKYLADVDSLVAAKRAVKVQNIATRLAETEQAKAELLAEQERLVGKPAEKPVVDPKFAELEAAYATADLRTSEGRAIAHQYLDAKIASYESGEPEAT